MPREKSFRLKTLNMEHTCSRNYRNPRCTASYIGKKLMKKVRRQPDIKLKDIQDAVHEKYVIDISVGKASKAIEKAQMLLTGPILHSSTSYGTKDGHANSPAIGSAQPSSNDQPTVHRAQPSSNDDVTTSAPPPPTNNQSNPRPKRQRKRSAVTAETLNATRNAARYMTTMRSAGR
nr:hypothetical protein CFP56_77987 [Quercus suber]